MKPTLQLSPRLLFLSADADIVRRQLDGADLPLLAAGPLRNEISTDEITPVPTLVVFDDRLGDSAHIGFKAGTETPIGRGALKAGGFSVLVAGARYGKGSSREHSPLAEKAAGIRLVIAESFERIYRQNADNVGLFTSTDFDLIDRIRRGEPIPIDDLLTGRDPVAAAVLRAGGLLNYGRENSRRSRRSMWSTMAGQRRCSRRSSRGTPSKRKTRGLSSRPAKAALSEPTFASFTISIRPCAATGCGRNSVTA